MRHLRKRSSLEIMQNPWSVPSRQSTLFDFTKDEAAESPYGSGEAEVDKDTEEEEDELQFFEANNGDVQGTHGYEYGTAEVVSIRSNSSVASVPQIQAVSARTVSSGSSCYTPRKMSGSSSEEPSEVDWQQLDRNEEQEKEDKDLPEGVEDESTAFLLARLEQENAKFSDPKSVIPKHITRDRSASRPPSMGHLKRLVQDRNAPSFRYSLAPDMALPEEPPLVTELEFWAALVQDYPSTAARLPTLTTMKIRSGIPPPLRGVVWTSMSGARDRSLEDSFDRLQNEKSPYEGIINKDVGRSFPGVDLFRDAEGEGQRMLGRVLKCFSLQDQEIGYCQGLGFLVGPLLMNMGEKDAFCVLVRYVASCLNG